MSVDHIYGLDEIKEDNNRVPLWLFLAWVSLISWGIYYLFAYWTEPQDIEKSKVKESSITYQNPYPEHFKNKSNTIALKLEEKKEDSNSKILAEGKQVYEANCAGCHGIEGNGKGPAAAALNPPPRNFVKADFKYGSDDASLTKTIENGVQGSAMPPWKGVLSDEQIKSVIAYIRTFKK
jgi:mono/diheme cytochrome c family protein